MPRKGDKDTGAVFKKGSWWCRLTHNGRERWHKCDSKTQAKTLYGRLKAQIREEQYFPDKFKTQEALTVRAWLDRCLKGSANHGKKNEERYGRFWKALLGKRLLSAVSTEDLRRIQTKLKAKWEHAQRERIGTGKAKRGKSPATINRHFAHLRHALALAVKDGKLDRNPISGVKFFAECNKTRFLSDKELTGLREHLPALDFKLVAFAVETGMRRAEQFKLRWKDVDLEHGVLTIPMSKSGKTRHVPLSDEALRILRSLDSLLSPWVFPSPEDSLKARSAASFVAHRFTPALCKAGIVGASWHTLRHTAASRRIAAGVDLVSVKEILGHRDIQTTMRYSHLSPTHLRDAVNRGSLSENGTTDGTSQKQAVTA